MPPDVTETTITVPPEWAPQKAIWTAWPADADEWNGDLEAPRRDVAALVRALREAATPCACWSTAPRPKLRRARPLGDAAELVPARLRRHLAARHGADLCAHARSGAVALRFRTNSWGGKYDLPDDATVGDDVARLADKPVRRFDFVLEGGAVDHDGEGTILTTRQTLLNPNRNGWTKEQAEAALGEAFGARKIIWIDEGLKNDHTDGHIDNIARFVGPGRVVCQAPSGRRRSERRDAQCHCAHARSCDGCRGPQARGGAHPRRRPLSQCAGRCLAGLAHELHHRQRRRRRAGLRHGDRRRLRSQRCRRCFPTARSSACRRAGCSAAARPAAARSTASPSRNHAMMAKRTMTVAAIQTAYGTTWPPTSPRRKPSCARRRSAARRSCCRRSCSRASISARGRTRSGSRRRYPVARASVRARAEEARRRAQGRHPDLVLREGRAALLQQRRDCRRRRRNPRRLSQEPHPGRPRLSGEVLLPAGRHGLQGVEDASTAPSASASAGTSGIPECARAMVLAGRRRAVLSDRHRLRALRRRARHAQAVAAGDAGPCRLERRARRGGQPHRPRDNDNVQQKFYGHSFIADHRGELVESFGEKDEGVLVHTFDLARSRATAPTGASSATGARISTRRASSDQTVEALLKASACAGR